MNQIKIDHEFKALCPPLTPDERQRLENSISADGCLSPVIVWDQEDVLLDGHNRKEICDEMGIEFPERRIQFPDRAAAFNWIICNQLSRRNLTPDQRKILIGMRYNAEKKTKAEAGASKDQNDPCSTAKKIASETGVSAATVKRAGKAVSEMSDQEKADVMAGKKKAKKKKPDVAFDRGVVGDFEKYRSVIGKVVSRINDLSDLRPPKQWIVHCRDLLGSVIDSINAEIRRITK